MTENLLQEVLPCSAPRQFLHLGQTVRAKQRILDCPGSDDPGPVHAEAGELGEVVHVDPECWPTITFARTGTSTCCTDDEVEAVELC